MCGSSESGGGLSHLRCWPAIALGADATVRGRRRSRGWKTAEMTERQGYGVDSCANGLAGFIGAEDVDRDHGASADRRQLHHRWTQRPRAPQIGAPRTLTLANAARSPELEEVP